MASWQNASGKENHKSLFDNVSHDRCIFCGSDREEIARTDFTIMFSEFEYSTGSICKSCYHANAKQVKATSITDQGKYTSVHNFGPNKVQISPTYLDRILSQVGERLASYFLSQYPSEKS